ncbi:MAG: NYN domain-containing protein [Oscillochloridaceae bacterium]|nr:NYN domain-containing protein [Chloroflexaceae bacterium]MDW8389154.1 NYN domain-containing protein [Oscillochloridaceae bacterium]
MYEQRRPDVAVFIDFENVYVSVRDKLNANPNFEAIMDRCGDLGRVVISRAYADWYRYPRVTSALYANAIEPIYVATYYYDKDMGRTGRAIKNSVDMNLCIDAMKTLFTNPNISRFVLVTGDRDFIPLVNSIRQQGKEVYIIGIGGAASTHLAQSADEFLFYEQLVGKTPSGSAAATAIASRATELNRSIEAALESPREPVVDPSASPGAPAAEPDIYDVLVEAIHLVRKRGYVSTLGSIKLVMKELMGGDFKESRYRDLNGRPFAKFKDFVLDAEKRGKVQIFTNGTVNEVFLPGEDPYKLSQFAAALSEEPPVEPVADTSVFSNGRKETSSAISAAMAVESSPTPGGRRRRRRSRRSQNAAAPAEALDVQACEADLDELEYTPPLEEEVQAPGEDIFTLDELEHAVDDLPLGVEHLAEEFVSIVEDVTEESDDLVEFAPPEPEDLLSEVSPAEFAGAVVEEFLPDAPSEAAAEAVAIAEAAPPAIQEGVVELLTSAEPAEATAETAHESDEGGDAFEALEPIVFSDEEWTIFREMMASFSRPVSFQQIFDTLRERRKEHNLVRTNEQLRSMVKQAINSGMLERSGRGKRVYYTLKAE